MTNCFLMSKIKVSNRQSVYIQTTQQDTSQVGTITGWLYMFELIQDTYRDLALKYSI